jgi:protease-4
VISVYPDVEGLLGKIGVDVTVIKSGKMKDSGSGLRKMTNEEKDYFQMLTNEYYEQFISIVYKNVQKNISLENLKTLADGRIYTAKQALDNKLINATGYFSDAFDKSLELANVIDAKVVAYTYYPRSKTNIYAANVQDTLLFDMSLFKEHIPKLKAGFYYLWLPEM